MGCAAAAASAASGGAPRGALGHCRRDRGTARHQPRPGAQRLAGGADPGLVPRRLHHGHARRADILCGLGKAWPVVGRDPRAAGGAGRSGRRRHGPKLAALGELRAGLAGGPPVGVLVAARRRLRAIGPDPRPDRHGLAGDSDGPGGLPAQHGVGSRRGFFEHAPADYGDAGAGIGADRPDAGPCRSRLCLAAARRPVDVCHPARAETDDHLSLASHGRHRDGGPVAGGRRAGAGDGTRHGGMVGNASRMDRLPRRGPAAVHRDLRAVRVRLPRRAGAACRNGADGRRCRPELHRPFDAGAERDRRCGCPGIQLACGAVRGRRRRAGDAGTEIGGHRTEAWSRHEARAGNSAGAARSLRAAPPVAIDLPRRC